MIIDVITLFPDIFKGFLGESIIRIAQEKGLVKINLHNLRDFTPDKHQKVDDRPYGGGPGMVLMAEPVFRIMEHLNTPERNSFHRVLLTPHGQIYTQKLAQELAQSKGLILLCGHYEGFDERIRQTIKFDEISIGDYILSGGEVAVLVLIDSVVRLIPGVLGNPESKGNHDTVQLDVPQYTRPRSIRGKVIPEVLLSGHHQKIKQWRLNEALKRKRTCPDVISGSEEKL